MAFKLGSIHCVAGFNFSYSCIQFIIIYTKEQIKAREKKDEIYRKTNGYLAYQEMLRKRAIAEGTELPPPPNPFSFLFPKK